MPRLTSLWVPWRSGRNGPRTTPHGLRPGQGSTPSSPAAPRSAQSHRRVAGGVAGTLLGALLVAVPGAAGAAADEVTDGLVLSYDLTQAVGTTVADTSGNGNDGTVNGGAIVGAGGLHLDGVDDHVHLPNDLLADLDSVTVSIDVLVDPTQATAFFLWGLGNPSTSASGTGYLFTSGNSFRAGITTTNWSGEKVTAKSPSGALARGVWKTVTYTQTGTTGSLYEDGALVGQNTAATVLPSQVGDGMTTSNNIGKSTYASDRLLKGAVRSFRIYDRALSDTEVAAIALTDAERLACDIETLELGDLSAVTDDVALPATGAFGSTIIWASSDPAVVSSTGSVVRPAPGSGPAAVTLTATLTRGSTSDTRILTATVLPGEDDQSTADAVAAALTIAHPDDVRSHLTLPTSGANDAVVTWASSAPEIVAADGIARRPARGSGNAAVTLTADVVVGDAHATRPFELTVLELPATEPYAGYAFSYFTGNSIAGEKIYFAASQGNDALHWAEVNGGRPVLESTSGTLGLRDPFLIRSPEGDRFFLIATDLSIGRDGNWDTAQRQGSQHLEVWESTDLVTWSEQRHVKVAPDTAGNTWAPEAYWDESQQQYIVFWASKLYAEDDPGHTGTSYNRMLYATTRDFVTFGEPQIWQDRGESRIDSTVIKESDTYYRFTKDEGGGGTGCSDIIEESSLSLTAADLPGAPSWTMLDSCIGRDAGTSAVEGPTVFKANPGDTSGSAFYLFVDEYGDRGYIPLGTDDLANPDWQVPVSYQLPASPRHGTVIPVTKTELDALTDTLNDAPDPPPSTPDGVVAHYPMDQASGDTVADASGNGNTGTLAGDATWSNGALTLGGTNGYVELPDNVMAGMAEITVSLDVKIAPDQATPYFIWGLGNTLDSAGNGYLFTTGDRYRTSIASGSWSTEQTVGAANAVPRGDWKTLTYTLDAAGTARLYLDGASVGEKTGITITPGDIGGGRTLANYIGRSVYSGDRYLKGGVRDFWLYNRALSPAEVAALGGNGTAVIGVELDSLKVPAIIDGASDSITLPVTPGTDLGALDPTYLVGTGSTVTPTGAADYTAPVELAVTAADGETRTWTATAVEMRSPVLPGFYADPNIAVFGDTYYIYATTDGQPGWSGRDFYVWTSQDLVSWERSAEPFLTLGGADGNVPWATGNAWAPTIIEKDGKYYFYFSGHNASVDRKTIGVAVADDPAGPFVAQPTAMILNDEAVTSGQAIDPAAFMDPATGKHYLFWGNGSPVYAELSDDMLSIEQETISRIDGLTNFREGAFVNYRDGIYHLTYSIDDTGSQNYRVGYATSSSVDGPWTYRGVILEKDPSQGTLGTGHSSIVQVPDNDEWYIAYHRFGVPGGDGTHRETTIDRLTFSADGTMAPVVPTLSSVDPLPQPAEASTTVVMPSRFPRWLPVPVAVIVRAGERPTGTVQVSEGGKALATGRLVASRPTGLKVLALPRGMSVGTHELEITYSVSAGPAGPG